MIIKVPALSLISVILALSCPMFVSAQKSKIIKFVSSGCSPALRESSGSSKPVSITLDARNVLVVEPSDPPVSYLFTAEAFFVINHKFKTYSVQSYGELEAKAIEAAKSQERTSIKGDVRLEPTEETNTIHGFNIRKIIWRVDSKLEEDIWVSSDLVPMKLRAAGERIRSVLTKDYWRKVRGNPGIAGIILLYGIPLKKVEKRDTGSLVCEAQVLDGSTSGKSFQVPPGYRKTQN